MISSLRSIVNLTSELWINNFFNELGAHFNKTKWSMLNLGSQPILHLYLFCFWKVYQEVSPEDHKGNKQKIFVI